MLYSCATALLLERMRAGWGVNFDWRIETLAPHPAGSKLPATLPRGEGCLLGG